MLCNLAVITLLQHRNKFIARPSLIHSSLNSNTSGASQNRLDFGHPCRIDKKERVFETRIFTKKPSRRKLSPHHFHPSQHGIPPRGARIGNDQQANGSSQQFSNRNELHTQHLFHLPHVTHDTEAPAFFRRLRLHACINHNQHGQRSFQNTHCAISLSCTKLSFHPSISYHNVPYTLPLYVSSSPISLIFLYTRIPNSSLSLSISLSLPITLSPVREGPRRKGGSSDGSVSESVTISIQNVQAAAWIDLNVFEEAERREKDEEENRSEQRTIESCSVVQRIAMPRTALSSSLSSPLSS